jgi:excisionase family DNA binding protein
VDSTLSVQQAAAHFGVSEKTIRRRIASGELTALKVPTAQGYEWRITPSGEGVHLDNMRVQVDGTAVRLDSTTVQVPRQQEQPPATSENVALVRALELADRLQQENAQLAQTNVQLAGQVGFLQAKLQGAEEQVRLLTVAPVPQVENEGLQLQQHAQNDQAYRPWWKRLFRI